MSNETAQAIVCPDCGSSWPPAMRVCPADGAPLGVEPRADDDDAPLAAGTQVGEYRIESLLGAGGMGEVYRARHPVIDKRVAIKIMSRHCSANPINVERFVHEAKAVNAIGHANIVDIFSFGHHDGRCFFVMEWLRGESLRQRLDREAITAQRSYEILEAVLRALEAAHAAGIVHRDLKPDNIFLVAARDDEPERVKLLDFGIAKLSDDGTRQRGSKTQTGTVVGTPAYMAPEQAGGGVIEGPSDIYSLGVVAFEMAAGRVPFDGEATVQIMAAHVCEPPPLPSQFRDGIELRFEDLILAMLEKTPAVRPTTAEVRAVIRQLRGGRIATSPPIGDVEVPSLVRGNHRSDAHAATAIALATPLPGSLAAAKRSTPDSLARTAFAKAPASSRPSASTPSIELPRQIAGAPTASDPTGDMKVQLTFSQPLPVSTGRVTPEDVLAALGKPAASASRTPVAAARTPVETHSASTAGERLASTAWVTPVPARARVTPGEALPARIAPAELEARGAANTLATTGLPRPTVSRPLPLTNAAAPKITFYGAGTGVVARSRTPIAFVLLGVAAVLIGIGSWLKLRGGEVDATSAIIPPALPVAHASAAAPAPTPMPPSRHAPGALAIEVVPADAVVAIDGTNQVLDTGHLDRSLDPGSYTITVKRDGYRTAITTLSVIASETTRWSTSLIEEPKPGTKSRTFKVASPRPAIRPPTPSAPVKKPDVDAVRDPFAPGGSK